MKIRASMGIESTGNGMQNPPFDQAQGREFKIWNPECETGVELRIKEWDSCKSGQSKFTAEGAE
jgi:hypothetical protein